MILFGLQQVGVSCTNQQTTELTWSQVYSANGNISSVACDSHGSIYIAVENVCYRSSDGGNHWAIFFQPSVFTFINQIEINNLDHIFITTYQFIYISTNSGITWRWLSHIFPHNIKTDIENNIYLIRERVFKSQDHGVFWFDLGPHDLYPYDQKLLIVDSSIFLSTNNGLLRHNPNGSPHSNIIKSNYLPLHLGNQWLYRGGEFGGYSYFRPYLFYSSVSRDSLFNNKKYYKLTSYGWVRYSNDEKKIYLLENGQDVLYLDFKSATKHTFPCAQFWRFVK